LVPVTAAVTVSGFAMSVEGFDLLITGRFSLAEKAMKVLNPVPAH